MLAVHADDEALLIRPSGVTVLDLVQPEESAAAIEEVKKSGGFATEGTSWLTFGAGIGSEGDESTDYNIHVAYSEFIVDRIEVGGELGLWYFDQKIDTQYGINPNLVIRWHFLQGEDWTVYADAGVGVLIASGDVPDLGTSFGLMPRAGVGFTHALGSGGTRVQLGLRWHHVSNARLSGDAKNPARDAPFLYVGIISPF